MRHGGASGLANVVIPMAKAFGIRIATSVLSDEIVGSIKHFKPDVIINTAKQKTSKILKAELAAGHPVDVTIDCLGGDGMGDCLPCLSHRRAMDYDSRAGGGKDRNRPEKYIC